MSTEEASSTRTTLRRSKPQGWRTILKGTFVTHKLRLSTPSIMLMCKRTYPQVDSRLYFALLVAPASLRDANGETAQVCLDAKTIIDNSLAKCESKITDEIARLHKLLASNSLEAGVGSGNDELVLEVHTPVSKKFLNCFTKADEFMCLLDSLWIESVLDDEQRVTAERKIRKILTAFASSVESAFHSLLRAMQAARSEATQDKPTEAEAEAAAAAEADSLAASVEATQDELAAAA